MQNGQYADLLDEIANLLDLTGASSFKSRAYSRVARTLRKLPEKVDDFAASSKLADLPGVGKSIANVLDEMYEGGSCDTLDKLRAKFPPGIDRLLAIQGLGPKKLKKVFEAFGTGTLDDLELLAKSGRLAELDGFGAKTAAKILQEIERLRRFEGRTPAGRAIPLAEALLARVREVVGVVQAEIAGSLRRGRETVGDLDIVVGATEAGPVMDAFVGADEVTEVIVRGPTKVSVYLLGTLQADLRVVAPEAFGAALHYFTGSKDHNIALRGRALKRGLRINEYGAFRLTEDGEAGERIASRTEADVFAAVALPFIPPELREGGGEIEAAEAAALPDLVTLTDIQADLHLHTTGSDGQNTLEEMAQAAAERGWAYIAVTDHSPALAMVGGLTPERLREQIEQIDAFNGSAPPITVLKGLEVDILADGTLDMRDELLESLDWVVGSVHSHFRLAPETMTARIVRAVESGLISALGHPTGRKIGVRDPFEFDFDAVLDACERMNVALEVNASLGRLDLSARDVRRVLQRPNLWLTINTDAHSTSGFSSMQHGLRMARRGWAPKTRVLNTLPLDAFLEARRKPARAKSFPAK